MNENISSTNTPSTDPIHAFQDLIHLPRWVPYRLKPSKARPGKTDKIPGTRAGNLSTSTPEHWTDYATARRAASGGMASGVGLVMTGGIRIGDYTLIGFDVDDARDEFIFPFETYTETSPSGKGVRAFAWAPAEALSGLADATKAAWPGCDHAEIYIGSAPRFLTITFDAFDEAPIVRLDDEETAELVGWLRKAAPAAPAAAPIPDEGAVVDLSKVALTEDQKRLLAGKGKGEFSHRDKSRNDIVHGLLVVLLQTHPPEDVLATIFSHRHLWQYCLDHRHENPERAVKFAREEIERAQRKNGVKALEDFGRQLREMPQTAQALQHAETRDVPAFDFKGRFLTRDLVRIKFPPREFVIEPHLPAKKMVEFSGAHGISKSTMALDMVCRVAAGLPWCGLDTRRGRAAFISREDDFDDILRRVQYWLGAQEKEARDEIETRLGENLCVLGSKDARGLVLTEKDFGKCTQRGDLVAHLSEIYAGFSLIVMETASRLHGGDEMNEDLMHFADAIEEIAERTGACVVVIRHVSKAAAMNKDSGSYVGRGGGAFSDAARSVLTLVKLDEDDLKKRGVALDGMAAAMHVDVLALEHAKSSFTLPHEPLYFIRGEHGVLQQVNPPPAMEAYGKRMLAYLERYPEGQTVRRAREDTENHGVPKHRVGAILEALEKEGKVFREAITQRGGTFDLWKVGRRKLI